ncbi:MGDG synthase family glycosyltransferase [Streptomyces meridianus]|uniref:Galactosyldiacylglycerol synthase n=1 Tax=Streptomyces meridianus TaxID=2938945 RepID=A0ABT0XBQ0_9ACTN|nr:galactosyldiacylglycerol synthase [Streptomyces meridianus]MCM2579946.1 galactosyldiacylglycerol synthase [Streptomyces meridianus]
MAQTSLILSASMGAGHDAVARELARRLRGQGHEATVVDLLTLLPAGAGEALREGYRFAVRRLPWIYAAVYRTFFGSGSRLRGDATPLARAAERQLLAVVSEVRPDVVVSTFHIAAQVTGGLRARGALRPPSVVAVTDFAVHRQWLHPGNDLHLCLTPAAADRARAGTGRPARVTGPVVPPHFRRAAAAPASRWQRTLTDLARGRPPVLLSAGAWGAGSAFPETAALLARSGFLPVVLCGNDDRLARRLSRQPGCLALGWVDDLAELMTAGRALVDNAAGQTAAQALAAGLPVVGYRAVPGHGAEGVREMSAAGLSEFAAGPAELLHVVRRLTDPGPFREQRIAAGRAAFTADSARVIARTASTHGVPHPL